MENTHPFSYGAWTFVHNGTLPNFELMRPQLLERMTPAHRAAIKGETDSELIVGAVGGGGAGIVMATGVDVPGLLALSVATA